MEAVTESRVVLRPERPDDREFVCGLYASTREVELQQVDWTPDQKAAFCRMQFEAQAAHYAHHYFDASFDIVERGGESIGRLYVYRGDRDIRIVDIVLTAAVRGLGIGTALIEQIKDEALRTGKSVSIHVERFNPALRLYRRLGFETVGEHGVYDLMRWMPTAV
jgi:GNAT superfamily N-acetyltransferase